MLVKQESKAHRPVPFRAAKHIEWRTIKGRKVKVIDRYELRDRKQSAGYERETEEIRKRVLTKEAQEPHDFAAAEWTHPNGHPRCRICGCEETTDGKCPGLKAEPVKHGPGAAGSKYKR